MTEIHTYKNLRAKSGKEKIGLFEHTIAVINLSDFLLHKLISQTIKEKDFKEIRKLLMLSAAYHDIGKCSLKMQNYLHGATKGKKHEEFFQRHNILSFAYTDYFLNIDDIVKMNVLHHHTIPYGDFENINSNSIICDISEEGELEVMHSFSNDIQEYIKTKIEDYVIIEPKENLKEKVSINNINLFCDITLDIGFNGLLKNDKNIIVRSLLLLSDRIISESINNHNICYNDDIDGMESITSSFNKIEDVEDIVMSDFPQFSDKERNKKQEEILDRITTSTKNKTTILSANAGFGKTLIGIRWTLRQKEKTLWVVPRNVIAHSTYNSLLSEVNNLRLSDKLDVGLMLGGGVSLKNGKDCEDIEELFDCNILVTNIDNFLGLSDKNAYGKYLFKSIFSNIIFDEFHEFVCDSPLFSSFINILHAREFFSNSKTLLMSATAIRLDKVFIYPNSESNINFVQADILYGDVKVNLNFNELSSIDELEIKDKDSFIVCDVVKHAQDSYKMYKEKTNDKKSLLIHSRFTEGDRNEIEDKIYQYHGKYSDIDKRNTVFGTNIIGVGLDISAKQIYDFVVTPEDTIQRGCGRGGRFNEYKEIDYKICLLGDKPSLTFVSKVYDSSIKELWIDMLKSNNKEDLTKNDLYYLYNKFYEEHFSEIKKFWKKQYDKSKTELLSFRPYSTHINKKADSKKTSNKLSWRGSNNSIFVCALTEENEISDPILLDIDIIRQENFSTSLPRCFKNYYDKLISDHKELKYVLKSRTMEKLIQLAHDSNYPFFLTYATYDKDLGLVLEKNTKND